MNAENQRQFVDTNVLIYAHDKSAGTKHDKASTLVDALWDSGKGCLSIQVLQEFYVVATRKLPKSGRVFAEIVSYLSQWTAHAPNVEDVINAIDIHQRYNISFWDGMIVRSAAQLRCGVIWSEDLNPGQAYEGVRVINPFA